ncbi:hypothetical protein B0H16DRAFT_1834958 [Mycena metata]|uniref:Uncharacterized protein n=1 Tax=Mycena metata TaxID=1033252 RepID=A0AAD7GP82_9AGAR|nr:hypothetical protein B0H16DRAFT_1834958 [Mycena metata]
MSATGLLNRIIQEFDLPSQTPDDNFEVMNVTGAIQAGSISRIYRGIKGIEGDMSSLQQIAASAKLCVQCLSVLFLSPRPRVIVNSFDEAGCITLIPLSKFQEPGRRPQNRPEVFIAYTEFYMSADPVIVEHSTASRPPPRPQYVLPFSMMLRDSSGINSRFLRRIMWTSNLLRILPANDLRPESRSSGIEICATPFCAKCIPTVQVEVFRCQGSASRYCRLYIKESRFQGFLYLALALSTRRSYGTLLKISMKNTNGYALGLIHFLIAFNFNPNLKLVPFRAWNAE